MFRKEASLFKENSRKRLLLAFKDLYGKKAFQFLSFADFVCMSEIPANTESGSVRTEIYD